MASGSSQVKSRVRDSQAQAAGGRAARARGTYTHWKHISFSSPCELQNHRIILASKRHLELSWCFLQAGMTFAVLKLLLTVRTEGRQEMKTEQSSCACQ